MQRIRARQEAAVERVNISEAVVMFLQQVETWYFRSHPGSKVLEVGFLHDEDEADEGGIDRLLLKVVQRRGSHSQ